MSTEITPNVPLLIKTLEHIEHHPEEWDQAHWHCNTTACFAGHAAVLDGGKWLAGTGGPTKSLMIGREGDPWEWVGGCIPVSERAQHILGLTEDQADRLFAGSNTLDDLRAEVYRLVGDFDKLAETAERSLLAAMNGDYGVLPERFVGPDVEFFKAGELWENAQDAIREWQKAQDGEVDLDTLEPQWRDAEVYTNHLRGLVDEAVNKLIGRPA